MAKVKKKLRILITGATGFIGSHAVTYYCDQGYKVRVLLRKNSVQKNTTISSDIEISYGDMTDKKSLFDATKKVDVVINFAARKSDEKDSYAVNVKGVAYLIEAARKNNVSKIIQISTISTKIKKLGTYGKTKAEGDRLLRESNVPYVILRPSVVYGDLKSGVFGSIVKASNLPVIPIFGDGKCFFYPIHVDDLIKATEIALLNKKLNNKIYDVGGPDKITFKELVQLLTKIQKKKPTLVYISPAIGIITAKILSKLMYRPPITVSNILGSTQIVSIDVQTFFKDFHFRPRSLILGFSTLFAQSQKDFTEAKLFFSYILPKKYKTSLTIDLYARYNMVLQKNNISFYKKIPYYFSIILGPLDAFSKLFFPESLLQKKLLITAALIETTPYSAEWLLPKSYSIYNFILTLFGLFITSAIKFILGFLLFLIPGVYKKYVI